MTTTNLTLAESKALEIKNRPHWRTHIAPTTIERRFEHREDARDAVIASVVLLRGWDFPHFHSAGGDVGGNAPIDDGWESRVEALGVAESWRVTQSGQFIHYVTLSEDAPSLGGSTEGRALSVEGAVYQITEIFEFAARLVGQADYEPAVTLTIGLTGQAGRRLVAAPIRGLTGTYESQEADIAIARTLDAATLPARKHEHSLDAIEQLFGYFEFAPSRDILVSMQQRCLQSALKA